MEYIKAKSFGLADVILHKESKLYKRMMMNLKYVLSLDCDRLLYHFRVYAGVDTKGAKSYGGWEGEWSDIKGEFMGHYIAALCNSYQSIEDLEIKEICRAKVIYIIDSLWEVQQAIGQQTREGYPGKFGYLAAIPTTQLDKVEQLTNKGLFADGVPYYVHHKTFRGLLYAYKVLGIKKAEKMAEAMAEYFYERNKDFSQEHLEQMLNSRRYPVQHFKEFGGMHEVMIAFYTLTQKEVYLRLGQFFGRKTFRDALIEDEDTLGYHQQHANSEIPCVVGMGKYYELTGEEAYKKGVLNFLKWMEEDHSTPVGGISGKSAYPDYDGELFHYPKITYNHMISSYKSLESNESCCSHNLNLLSTQAFTWTKDAHYMHHFEKRFVNGVLGQQDPDTGMFIYHLNMNEGSKKNFGTPDDAFWCCYCSGIEAYSSLQHGAFQYDENTLWVNNYIDAELNWKEQDVKLNVYTNFPDDGEIKITLATSQDKLLKMCIRQPSWVQEEVVVYLNGEVLNNVKQVNDYMVIEETFRNGDKLEMTFSYSLRGEYLLDRPEHAYVYYGPHFMVALNLPGTEFEGTLDELLQAMKPTGKSREFYVHTTKGRTVFMPITEVRNEIYNGFIRITQPVLEQMTDCIEISSDVSETLHEMKSAKARKEYVKGKYYRSTDVEGWLSYKVKVNPTKQMQIRCFYDGSETNFFSPMDARTPYIRLFDIQVKDRSGHYQTFMTQNIDKLNEGGSEYINYPIPLKYTIGQEEIEIRFIAKDFGAARGVVGSLCTSILVFYLEG